MRRPIRHGDTLIEVMLSISIFALVAMITINLMNDGINTAQRTLETEMARNEIDSQAEALRYIHNNYVSERNMDTSQFRAAWRYIINRAMKPSETKDSTVGTQQVYFDINNMESCETPYLANNHLQRYKAFVINPRLLIPNNFNNDSSSQAAGSTNIKYLGIDYDDLLDHMLVYYSQNGKLTEPSLYPRIVYNALAGGKSGTNSDSTLYNGDVIYNDVASAEGIWINAVGNSETSPSRSDYYDFYIRTCWHPAGTKTASTITTVVRLYNPEVME